MNVFWPIFGPSTPLVVFKVTGILLLSRLYAIAAVLVDDNEEATLKRIKHVGDQILLMPDNTNGFSPIILSKENPGRILGKVFEVRRKM